VGLSDGVGEGYQREEAMEDLVVLQLSFFGRE